MIPVNEPFDWVDKVSVELTARMLSTLLDFPYDQRRKLVYWTEVTSAGASATGGPSDVDAMWRAAAEMARSFNAMLDRLESLFQSQRAFVQDASHELRDPLTICRGHLELLGDDPEEQRKTIALVMDEIDRMGGLVDDLQLLSEAEQPDFLRVDLIDLAPFTHELRDKASALAPRRWTVDHAADGEFLGDRHRLTEAVMNLAHNAVQHTVEHDSISIGTSSDDTGVRVWVRDTGQGIAVSDQSRIFERFTRGRDAHRRYRGGGLGLAIVQAIAEAHGGRVDLESRLGEGSTFTMVLPREPDRVAGGEGPDRRA